MFLFELLLPRHRPEPPEELQRLLEAVGMEVRWDSESKKYRRPEVVRNTSGSSQSQRLPTAQTARHLIEVTPDVADARIFEDRLKHAYADGGFLVLTVKPSKMRSCEAELMRRFKLDKLSFDDLLFDALRVEAEELEIDWSTIESADGTDRSSPDWGCSPFGEYNPRQNPGLCAGFANIRHWRR